MKRLAPVCLLGIAASAGSASATRANAVATNAGPTGGTCQAPTATTCKQAGYVDRCSQHRKACKPHLEQAWKANHQRAGGVTSKMFRVDGDDIPKDVRTGKRYPYTGPKKRYKKKGTKKKTGKKITKATRGKKKLSKVSKKKISKKKGGKTGFGKAGPKPKIRKSKGKGMKMLKKSLFARTGLTNAPSGPRAQPWKAHRRPKWDQNGVKVATCQEYAYEQLYDWTRFTDAVAACHGDHNCIMGIAFRSSTPGIADRALRRKDGRTLDSDFKWKIKTSGTMPKNDFFAYGSGFVYSGGPDGIKQHPQLDTLKAEIDKGVAWYGYGKGRKNTHTYKNEWAFHKALWASNKTVSLAEQEEYDRRKAKFRELLDQHYWAVQNEMEQALKGSVEYKQWEHPLDHVIIDPISRLTVLRGRGRKLTRDARKFIKTLPKSRVRELKSVGGGINATPVPRGRSGLPQRHSARSVPAIGVLAAPARRRGAPTTLPSGASKGAVKGVDECKLFKGKGSEVAKKGPISCQIGRMLRQEWDRKRRGQRSCLDLGMDDCDWSYQGFKDRFVAGVPYLEKQAEYEQKCKQWIRGGWNPQVTLFEAEKEIRRIERDAGEAKEKLQPYAATMSSGDVSYGQRVSEGDTWGDKSKFAAGYGLDTGWKLAPRRVGNDINKDVCEFDGRAWAEVGVNGWLFGKKVPMLDGSIEAKVKGSKKSGHVHLDWMLGSIIPSKNLTFSSVWKNEDMAFGKSFPKPKPSFTFMAGPVPVTGAVWGELGFGNEVQLYAKTKGCDIKNPGFSVGGTLTPFFWLAGYGQVGVGISGIVSAGIRGMVNLIIIGFPIDVSLDTVLKGANKRPYITFNTAASFMLGSLSGAVSLYVEFLFFEDQWEIFGWNGLKANYPLTGPEGVELPLTGW